MPQPRRFFLVLRERGQETFHVFHDTPPTKSQLAGHRVVYRLELKGRWREAPLADLIAEYRKRREAGTLPASNMTAPPKKREETRVSYEIGKRPWCTGDLERELREGKKPG